MQQSRDVQLANGQTHKADRLGLCDRQAVIHQTAAVSSDIVHSSYWEREQAAGEGSELLGKGAGYWEREQATWGQRKAT